MNTSSAAVFTLASGNPKILIEMLMEIKFNILIV